MKKMKKMMMMFAKQLSGGRQEMGGVLKLQDVQLLLPLVQLLLHMGGTMRPAMACRLLPLVLVQVGGGEVCGRTTGAKALFCLIA